MDGAGATPTNPPPKPILPWGASCGGPRSGTSTKMTPLSAVPSGDIAMPLDEHLLPFREHILQGEFIDFLSLLYQDIERKDKDLIDDKDKEVLKKRKMERTWANWLSVFLFYASVIVRKHPECGPIVTIS